MEKKTSTKKIVLAVVIVALVAVAMFVLYKTLMPKGQAGDKKITVTVVHADDSEKEFTYQTDAEYLGEVITGEGLVKGQAGEFGMFITTADKETADDGKQQWWCLTKGGEMVTTSADQAPIADGDAYELTLKEGY